MRLLFSSSIVLVTLLRAVVASSGGSNTKTAKVSSPSSDPSNVVWTSPEAGVEFVPGQVIVASWQSPSLTSNPSFALCVQLPTGDDCGASIYPTVAQSTNSSYSMSIIAPNVTSQGSFFLKMVQDSGQAFSSPDFDLTPQGMANSSAVIVPVPTSSLSPTFGTNDLNTNKSHPSATAIAVPVTLIVIALIASLLFCLTKSRRDSLKAANAVALGPSTSSNPKAALNPGDDAFFNISLNKTNSELSSVEKAVCGAIGANAGIYNEPAEAKRSGRRRDLFDEDEHYTVPPPRAWKRQDSDRMTRDRYWSAERQHQRERDLDRRWEDQRDGPRRRTHTDGSGYGYDHDRDRDDLCYTTHSAPEHRRSPNWNHDRGGRDLTRQYDSHRKGPPERDPRLSRGPSEDDYHDQCRRESAQMRNDDEHHSSLSVVSAYLMPSPYLSGSGYPASPYMGQSAEIPQRASLPPSLQAGGGHWPEPPGPRYPPGLDESRGARLRDYGRHEHGRFDFEQRQASQFRFSSIGASAMGTRSSSGPPNRPGSRGFSVEKPLPLMPGR